MRPVILLLLISCVSGCSTATPTGAPPLAVKMPPAPAFMGACPPSGVKVGDPPDDAFDREHAAWKECSAAGAQSRTWYQRLRARYGAPKKE